MARYILVGTDGVIYNAIEYDGKSPVRWPAGLTVHQHDTAQHGVDLFDPVTKKLSRDADPANITAQAQAKEAAIAQAEHEALIAKLILGKASPEEMQAALAKVLGSK